MNFSIDVNHKVLGSLLEKLGALEGIPGRR